MNDITGHPELTPYRGGWAATTTRDALTAEQKGRARDLTARLGDRLAQEGYRGFFEVDFLVDTGTGELYLGELNPRISGISSMTNVTAGAYADMPLFLFHLLEYLDVDYEVDIGEINEPLVPGGQRRRLEPDHHQGDRRPGRAADRRRPGPASSGSARSGTSRSGAGANDWHGDRSESEAFYLRIQGPGDYRYRGRTSARW